MLFRPPSPDQINYIIAQLPDARTYPHSYIHFNSVEGVELLFAKDGERWRFDCELPELRRRPPRLIVDNATVLQWE